MGALLLAASLPLLVWAAVSALVHELGHWLAIKALGGQVAHLRLTGVGAVLQPRRETLFSYGEECLVALAGPTASLVLASLAGAWGRTHGGEGAFLLTGVSLALGIFNLLPALPLDGGRVLRAAVSQLAGPDAGERACLWAGRGVALLLVCGGGWVFGLTGNFTLLLCGLWLLAQGAGRRGRVFSR